jgi:hypothetical protein
MAFETVEDDLFRELEGEDPLRVVGTAAVGSTLLSMSSLPCSLHCNVYLALQL